ncbi:MAG: hypothetical protein AW06_002163 [Candidatus Accumulibacter cognatus]|uniref:Uncharacterized protein n=1 Tax=Candidatus Accumulibacter cognatus TaxID=2954383 RepID=A0A080M5X2_9PROT|nr:MAG: hypothetical protein AW06_002163 [Candidatus Accumulibacter cognatus]
MSTGDYVFGKPLDHFKPKPPAFAMGRGIMRRAGATKVVTTG